MTASEQEGGEEATPGRELIDPDKVKITWAGLRASPRYMLKELRSNWWAWAAEFFFNWW